NGHKGRYSNGNDRRSPRTVPFIRDWITRLRDHGADFDTDAARAAAEVAFAVSQSTYSPNEIFQAARAAYYRVLTSDHRGL
ncbi:MAG TPA: hypothetical protein VG408_10895, partial [Actinomycetota bacterium]|nr:hypothetical protein [Actinomycetota bacterium]